jgi:hypothetical protein
MEELSARERWPKIISMKEFLEAMTGSTRRQKHWQGVLPPGNRTEWAGEGYQTTERMLRNVTHTPLWSLTLHGGISSI